MKRIEKKSHRNCVISGSFLGESSLFAVILLSIVAPWPSKAAEGILSRGWPPLPAQENAILTDGIRVTCKPSEYSYIDQAGKALTMPKAEFRHLCRFQEGLAAVEVVLRGDDPWGQQHWGYVNEEGRFAIPAKFQYASDFHDGLAAVNVGGKPRCGADPNTMIPMVDDRGRHHVYLVSGGTWGLVNKHGELVIQPKYTEVSQFSEGLAFVSTEKDCGYINQSGQMVIKGPLRYSGDFSGRLASFSERDKWGFIDIAGNAVIPAKFFSVSKFACGLAEVKVSENGKVGYIDTSGAVVIQPQFDHGSCFSEGLAAVYVGGKAGFIDTSGKLVIPARYEMAFNFSEGLAPVRIESRWGYIDRTGKTTIVPRFVAAGLFRHGIARVATAGRTFQRTDDCIANGTWGYIDRNGKFVIPSQFDQALDFWEGKAIVQNRPKFGLVDAQGKVVTRPQYDTIGVCNEGLVTVFKNGQGGFMDPRAGRLVIPPRFDRVDGFSCGRAAVCQDYKWGFINKAGDFVVRPQYTMVSAFSEGLAAVEVGAEDREKWGYIDTDGRMTIQPKFDSAGNFSEGLAAVELSEAAVSLGEEDEDRQPGGKWGFIDKSGKFVIEPRFTSADDFSHGQATVHIGEKQFKVDRKGSLIEVM